MKSFLSAEVKSAGRFQISSKNDEVDIVELSLDVESVVQLELISNVEQLEEDIVELDIVEQLDESVELDSVDNEDSVDVLSKIWLLDDNVLLLDSVELDSVELDSVELEKVDAVLTSLKGPSLDDDSLDVDKLDDEMLDSLRSSEALVSLEVDSEVLELDRSTCDDDMMSHG